VSALFQQGDLLLDCYRIEGKLGEGGMGCVYEVTNLALQRREALKLMQAEYAQSSDLVRRFLREARAAASASLDSDHVVRVYACGTLPSGEPYMTLEYLSGTDLEAKLEKEGALPVGEVVRHVREACLGLAEVHAQGLVHRDVKPSNLFLAERKRGAPQIKVIDFGIVKAMEPRLGHTALTELGEFAPGTLLYMSPERLASDDVDARADVWALGVVLYELITGRRPYPDANRVKLFNETRRPLAGVPGVPPALEAVILRCLAPNVEQRYASAAELGDALAPFDVAGSEASVASAVSALGEATARVQVPAAPAGGSVSPYATTLEAGTREPLEPPAGAPSVQEQLVTATPVQARAPMPATRSAPSRSRVRLAGLIGASVLLAVAGVEALTSSGAHGPEERELPSSTVPASTPPTATSTPTPPLPPATESASTRPVVPARPPIPASPPPSPPPTRSTGSAVAKTGKGPEPPAMTTNTGSVCDWDQFGKRVCK
jgi:eukaryotic-like serine/threonine-protein kinase